MKKISLILIALSVITMFTACANGNDSSSSNVCAVYKGTQRIIGGTDREITHTYGNDGIMTISVNNVGEAAKDTLRGPYEGNPNEDGVIKVELKEERNSSGEWVKKEPSSKSTYTVSNGSYKAGITMTRQ